MATIHLSLTAQQLIVALTQMGEQEQMEFVELLLKEPGLREIVEEIEDILDAERREPEPAHLLDVNNSSWRTCDGAGGAAPENSNRYGSR